jgi:hypothetical protein
VIKMRSFSGGQRKSSFRKTDRSRRLARTRTLPALEWLEDRIVLSSYVVTNTNYRGTGSLGAASSTAVSTVDTDAQISFTGLANNSTIALTNSDVNTLTCYGPTAYGISDGFI